MDSGRTLSSLSDHGGRRRTFAGMGLSIDFNSGSAFAAWRQLSPPKDLSVLELHASRDAALPPVADARGSVPVVLEKFGERHRAAKVVDQVAVVHEAAISHHVKLAVNRA